MDRFDYIIAGAGAAGLSLLMHMIDSKKFSGKQILLVDRAPKNANDRTWCFWEKQPGLFEPVVYREWKELWFHDSRGSLLRDISPYMYKLIRGADFYAYCFDIIFQQPNVTVRYGNVEGCVSDADATSLVLDGEKIHAQFIFNSILFSTDTSRMFSEKASPTSHPTQSPTARMPNQSEPTLFNGRRDLLQHFRGWVIDTDRPIFDPSRATLMDFRVPQVNDDTTFVYVMPFSSTRALVEYTMFSKEMLPDEEYNKALRDYLAQYLEGAEYSVAEREAGVIPMTDYQFSSEMNHIINIGTAGGQTKGSTGYTFQFIQKNSAAIVRSLVRTGEPFVRRPYGYRRFRLYDSVLLEILASRLYPGEKIFSTLMRGNRMPRVLKFLDNDTSLLEEWRIIKRLPTVVFLKALWRCR